MPHLFRCRVCFSASDYFGGPAVSPSRSQSRTSPRDPGVLSARFSIYRSSLFQHISYRSERGPVARARAALTCCVSRCVFASTSVRLSAVFLTCRAKLSSFWESYRCHAILCAKGRSLLQCKVLSATEFIARKEKCSRP